MKTFFLILLFITTSWSLTWAHPIPGIPVRSNLENGQLKVQIELDLRCFEQDPEGAPYILYEDLKKWGEISRNTAFQMAEKYVNERIRLIFSDLSGFKPEYRFRFIKLGGGSLEKAKDVVVIVAEMQRKVEHQGVVYSVESLMGNELSVDVINMINGKALPRKVSLFPGEKSYEWSLRPSPALQ